jgi:hypothetical protein
MPVGDKVVPIHQPGLKGRRAPGQGAGADVLLPPPAPPKPKRKAGWAKAKPKAVFKGKVKGPAKERTVIGPKSSIQAPSTKARPSTRPDADHRSDSRPGAKSDTRPGAKSGQKPGFKPGPKAGPKGAPKAGGPPGRAPQRPGARPARPGPGRSR